MLFLRLRLNIAAVRLNFSGTESVSFVVIRYVMWYKDT